MNILRGIPSFLPRITGPAIQVLNISNLLEEKGYTTELYYTYKENVKGYTESKISKEPTFRRHPIRIKHSLLQYGPLFMRKPQISGKFDVVHIHEYRYKLSEKIIKYAMNNELPIIIQPHGALLGYSYFVKNTGKNIYRFYDAFWKKKFIENSDKVIVSTQIEKKDALKFGFEEEKISKIAVGYNKDILTTSINMRNQDNSKDQINISFIGRICESRNVHLLLNAYSKLKIEYKDIKLTIVGESVKRSHFESANYMSILKQYNNKNELNVNFIGQVTGINLFKEFAKTDIYVFPSLYENLGQTIMEAATAGCCLLASNTGIAPDLIGSNERGLLLDNVSSEEIYLKLKYLIENSDIIRRCKKDVQNYVVENYSWDNIIKKYEEVYSSVL